MPSKGRLAEKSAATRAVLIAAAREVFAQGSFAETSIEDIVRRAKVTRGALYHHFDGKLELFCAVYEAMEAELAARSMLAASKGSNPLEMTQLGVEAFLEACLEPDVQRIVLIEAVGVLGWETWEEIGERHNFGLLRAGIVASIDAGQLDPRPPDMLTHLIQGALMRAGLVVARAEDPLAAKDAMSAEIRKLLESLKAQPRERLRLTTKRKLK
ncbi:MAG TPA: helix-turn-helix domain-containing protein [Actinomycetota bacterium]